MKLKTFQKRLKEKNVSDEYLGLACMAFQVSKASGYPVKEIKGFDKLPVWVRIKIGEAIGGKYGDN